MYGGISRKFSSIEAFYESLQLDKTPLSLELKKSKSELTAKLEPSSTKFKHLILYDPTLVREINEAKEIFLDLDQDIHPNIESVKGILTIMMKKYKVSVY